MALLPCAAPVKTLTYTIDSTQVWEEADIQFLNIPAKELIITIKGDYWAERTEFIVSLLSRMSHFDHFTRLELNFQFDDFGYVRFDSAQRILKELVRTIEANQELETVKLDLRCVLREYCLKDILEFCGDHKELRNVDIEIDLDDFGFFDYPWFKRVLSRNRRIEVRGSWMKYVTDEQEVDELYSLNRFYNGSESLTKESLSERTALIGIALTKKASGDFQCSALLMASYTDSLCEFVHSANMDNLTEMFTSCQISEDISLLEAIPFDQLTPMQVARWRGKYKTPTYRLLRDPQTLDEFESLGPRIAIWMKNGTLVQIFRNSNYPDWEQLEVYLRLTYCPGNLGKPKTIIISGNTDDAVADTAMFWWGLHCPEECNSCMDIDNYSSSFYFGAIKTKHLAAIFAMNQERRVKLKNLTLNDAQSVFFATRKHPIDLTLDCGVDFIDGGDSFVNVLQTRRSQFGSLRIGINIPLRKRNVERLLHSHMFTKLALPAYDGDMALLPLSSPVKSLEYMIESRHVRVGDIQSLVISAEELTITIHGEAWVDGIDVVESFLGRLAAFDHFKHLAVTLDFDYRDKIKPQFARRILKELFKTIAANQELESLNLEMINVFLQRDLKDLLESCSDHKGLRNIEVEIHPKELDFFDYPWFKRLLSRNRRLEVHGSWMVLSTVKQEIDELYSFNRFYNGSESLRAVLQFERMTLIGTTLTEKASGGFQRSALLIANHTYSLCELIQSANLDINLAVSGPTVEDERYSTF